MIDLTKIRQDLVDYGDQLFLNSAGASLMPRSVVKKISDYLHLESRQGGYYVADQQAAELAQFEQQLAKLLGTTTRNVTFAHSATDGYVAALSSIPFKSSDIILTSDDDYVANQLQFLSLQKRFGIIIKSIKNLPNGDLDLMDFEKKIKEDRPRLVAVTHVPTNSGLVQDVSTTGKICAEKEIIFLLDACQSVGQMEVTIDKYPCDFLTATGRKFLRGPRGTGFMYVSDRMLEEGYEPLYPDGNGAVWTGKDTYEIADTAARFTNWERPYALVQGLTEALRYLHEVGIKNIELQNKKVVTRLRERLAAIPEVALYDRGSETCNIITFRKEKKTQEDFQKAFSQHQIYYGISQSAQGQIDFEKKGVDWVVRLSPHYFNTEEEMDRVAEIVAGI